MRVRDMQKVTIRITDAKPDMITAEDIHSTNNMLLVGENTALTERKIARLKLYGIMEFKVFAADDQSIVDDSDLGVLLNKPQSILQSFKAFRQAFSDTTKLVKESIEQIVEKGTDVDTEELLGTVDNILKETKNGTNIVNMVHYMNMVPYMKELDDETYVHSINVALICNVFGRWLDLDPNEVDILTLSGLLHDIGKTRIPSGILLSHEELSAGELAIMRNHALYGYEILREKNLDPRVKNVALMHHERNDGSGYPLGLLGNKIEPLAKIVSIVNVFVGMTTNRNGKVGLCPFDVMDILESEGLHQFDTGYLFIFLERIAQSYIGEQVRLTNGMQGEVVMLNDHAFSRPIVRVGDTFVDLLKTTNLKIEAII